MLAFLARPSLLMLFQGFYIKYHNRMRRPRIYLIDLTSKLVYIFTIDFFDEHLLKRGGYKVL
jgi:hypothetical protein